MAFETHALVPAPVTAHAGQSHAPRTRSKGERQGTGVAEPEAACLLNSPQAAGSLLSSRKTDTMDICIAGQSDLAHLAWLLWLHAAPEEQAKQSVESFSVDLAAWWTEHDDSHLAFIARFSESEVVAMAWVALVPRVPRPGANARRSADIQSVFVAPEHRGKRIGSSLIQAAYEHALRRGASRVTVHSGREAVLVYERLGFASSRQLLQKEAQ